MTNYYYDTEFAEDGKVIDLISIGIVSEDGREFYRESSEFDESKCNDWVKKNVLPKLGPKEKRKTKEQIRQDLLDFIGDDRSPRFIAYVATYDHMCLCQLFGDMSKLPPEYPHYSWDLKQWLDGQGKVKLPQQNKKGDHNALEDARWLKDACDFLTKTQNLRIPANKKKVKSEGVAVLQTNAKDTKTLAMIAVKYQLFLLDPKAEKKDMLISVDPPFNFPSAVDQVLKTSKFQDLKAVVVVGLEDQIANYLQQVERLDVTDWLDMGVDERMKALTQLAKKLDMECSERLREPDAGDELVYGEDEEEVAAGTSVTARKVPYPSDLPKANRDIWDAVPKQDDYKLGWGILKARIDDIRKSVKAAVETVAKPKKKKARSEKETRLLKKVPPGMEKYWDKAPGTVTDKFDQYVLMHRDEDIRLAAHANFYEIYCVKMNKVPWSTTSETEVLDAAIKIKGFLIQGEEKACAIKDELFEHLEHAGLVHKERARRDACLSRSTSDNRYEISWLTPWSLKPEKGHTWLQISSFIKREFGKKHIFREADGKKRLVTTIQVGSVTTELAVVRSDETTLEVYINNYLSEWQAATLSMLPLDAEPKKIEQTLYNYCKHWKSTGKFPKIHKDDNFVAPASKCDRG